MDDSNKRQSLTKDYAKNGGWNVEEDAKQNNR